MFGENIPFEFDDIDVEETSDNEDFLYDEWKENQMMEEYE